MPVQFIGAIGSGGGSESRVSDRAVVDKVYLGAIARAHEAAGFDRVLIGYSGAAPDGFQIAAYAFQQTQRLKILLAHRPGFVAPTLAARQLATLDQFSDGRLAVHIITGGSDAEQQRDGDFLTKAERYARTDDYLDLVKKTWTSPKPFDHDGPYYRVRDSFSAVKPVQQPHIPVYFGGSSQEAIDVAGRQADVFALWGETLEQTAETIAQVRASAARYGRENHIQFSLSLRPVLARTEEEAWARAARILENAKALRDKVAGRRFGQLRNPDGVVRNVGSQRLLETAAGGAVRDKRLWTEIAALTGASGNSTGLVGTPAQVAESLLEYYDLGITNFLIRGFDPFEDALDYGDNLIPLVRAAVAERDGVRIAAE
ncbi:MAG: LLM class flavin-dependent oxidoreductase [Sphingobium sp.]